MKGSERGVPRSFLLRPHQPRKIRHRKHVTLADGPANNLREQASPPDDGPDSGIRGAKRRVRGAVGEIINAMRIEAEAGSCVHAKFLFEFAGIEFGAEKSPEEDSLSAVLLERLDEMQRRWREEYGTEFPPYGEATARKVE
jgi:hypothetical protein